VNSSFVNTTLSSSFFLSMTSSSTMNCHRLSQNVLLPFPGDDNKNDDVNDDDDDDAKWLCVDRMCVYNKEIQTKAYCCCVFLVVLSSKRRGIFFF
jgi:hypothetical protein